MKNPAVIVLACRVRPGVDALKQIHRRVHKTAPSLEPRGKIPIAAKEADTARDRGAARGPAVGRDFSMEPAGSSDTEQELQELKQRVRVLSEVTRRFAEATTDYQRLLQIVASSLAETIGDSCMVFLLDESGTGLSACSMHAIDSATLAKLRESFAERKLMLAERPAFHHVLTSGQPLLVPRLSERGDASPELVRWRDGIGLHSVLVIPVRVQGRSIGALTLGRYRSDAPAFTQHDLEVAQNLADHAGLAIENARLFQAAENAREHLRKSEAAQRQFFESSLMPSYVVDVESERVVAANQAALALYGYTQDEFLGLALKDLRYPEDQEALDQQLKAAGKADLQGLARHRRKDGTVIHVEGGSHLASFDGRPARFVMLTDQSKRVQAELDRERSEQRLRRTLDDMKEGYTIMSRDLRYLYMNRAGAEHTHLPREQLLGRTPMELYPGFEGSKIHRALEAAASSGEWQRVLEEFTHADGELGYFELNIQPVPEGIVVLSIDQTERMRAEKRRDSLEEQLRQSQKMEAVGRLAGGIAHDFNNMLSIILGYGEDILGDLPEGSPLREDMAEIHAAASRAADLTRQLLTFSRQQVLEPKVLDLNEVLSSMQRMLGRLLGEHLELKILPDPDLGRIRADRSNVEQVIMNLAVNARDAMPTGGCLTIETSNVVIDDAFARQHLGSRPGEYVFLGVTDTGVGMDQDTRARIFEPFFSTKAPTKGTGLGLSTVHGIVQQSGGAIFVYSELAHGTTFKIYLPRVDTEVEPTRPTLPPGPMLGTETILLVEDEVPVREVARRILERYGYTVLVSETARDALEVCEQHPGDVHLLLTDVVMPDANGVELAAQLKQRRPGLKVLFMSGYTDGSIASRGVLEKGASFLQKPFSSELLARKVRAALDGADP